MPDLIREDGRIKGIHIKIKLSINTNRLQPETLRYFKNGLKLRAEQIKNFLSTSGLDPKKITVSASSHQAYIPSITDPGYESLKKAAECHDCGFFIQLKR